MSGVASAQAIDCASNALNHSERAVCASEPLRELAASIDKRYPRVADGLGVKQSQLEWTRVRDRCNGNLACLTTAYRERDAYLARLPVIAKPSATTTASAAPVKHLFLRHAPAQLLSPSATIAAAPPEETASAGERLERAAGPASPIGPTPHWNTLWFLGGVLFASILLWQMLTNVCGKCPSCHHWFARVEIDRRQLTSETSEPASRRLGRRSRASAGFLSLTEPGRERTATVRHYNQCRICLHEWETITKEEAK